MHVRRFMLILLLLAGLSAGCDSGGRTTMTKDPQMNDPLEREIDASIQRLLSPFGGAEHQTERERALAVLLAHPDQAHPRLLEILDQTASGIPPTAVIAALPLFGRPESVPLLERIMRTASEPAILSAADALARHPHPSAGEALVRGLRDQRPEMVAAAANGLLTRGDRQACAALVAVLGHPDAEVRYHVLQAAAGLGCVPEERLTTIGNRDDSEMVRDLARRLTANRR